MRNISRAALGSVAIGMVAAMITASPADAANAAHTADAADTATIDVPSDFVQKLSDTRATGHYEVVGSALHIWTEGNTGTDKVAEYVDTATPLADLYALTKPQHPPWQVDSRLLFHDVPCRFCYKSECPQGHHDCLAKVAPVRVVDAVCSLIDGVI